MANLNVDFSAGSYGRIRPLHGVNSGPMTKVFTYDARDDFRDAGIPYARLHDVEYPYGSGEFVDIHCIFKNFDADENDPANYTFGLTDKYIEAIFDADCKPFFRLGESIEHAPIKKYVFPPKDYEKWARICEHIIRHYTEGWANGYLWNIEYWEIWNEPAYYYESTWNGSSLDFYRFYETVACHLKECFPHIKIGGYSSSQAIGQFDYGFFDYIRKSDKDIPLDFYSWHKYAFRSEMIVHVAKHVRCMLDEYGFYETESICNEWNYNNGNIPRPETYRILKSAEGGAFACAVLCGLQQDTDVKLGAYFEADVVKEWCGLFDVAEMSIGSHGRKATMKRLSAYWAFKAFNELYKMSEAVDVYCDNTAIKSCAARGDGRVGVLIANHDNGDTETTVTMSGMRGKGVEVRITDAEHEFDVIGEYESNGDTLELTLELKNNSFVYIGSKVK